MGIGIATYYILAAIMNKIYLYLVDWIDVTGVFVMFAAVDVVGVMICYIFLPETEGRSFQEIERYFTKKVYCENLQNSSGNELH